MMIKSETMIDFQVQHSFPSREEEEESKEELEATRPPRSLFKMVQEKLFPSKEEDATADEDSGKWMNYQA